MPGVHDSVPVNPAYGKIQERVKNTTKTKAVMLSLKGTDFLRDLSINGYKKALMPGTKQNSYTHTNPKFLNIDS
jgi:hypothetical protein